MRIAGSGPKGRDTKIGMGGRSLSAQVVDEVLYKILERIARRALRRKNKIPPICVSSNDLIARRIISTGIFESSQLESLDKIIEDRLSALGRNVDNLELFVDVGANIGIYSLRYSKYFERTIAIEANPVTYKLLEANLILQNCSTVTPLCLGASDKTGESTITIKEEGNLGGAAITGEDSQEADGFLTIPTRIETLEAIVHSTEPDRRIDLIKVDVEGHEASVLRGARNLLKRDKPVVLYERTGSSDGKEIDRILEECGYETFCLFERVLYFDGMRPKSALQIHRMTPDNTVNSALICAY